MKKKGLTRFPFGRCLFPYLVTVLLFFYFRFFPLFVERHFDFRNFQAAGDVGVSFPVHCERSHRVWSTANSVTDFVAKLFTRTVQFQSNSALSCRASDDEAQDS